MAFVSAGRPRWGGTAAGTDLLTCSQPRQQAHQSAQGFARFRAGRSQLMLRVCGKRRDYKILNKAKKSRPAAAYVGRLRC